MNELVEKLIRERWRIPEVWGEASVEEPELIFPVNTWKALQLINKHVRSNSNTLVHTDVDMDGFGTNYIIRQFMRALGLSNLYFIVNKDKEHGIQQRHADYVNGHKEIRFVIITDSSCNELETIKNFNCDVLVVDHHEVLHSELSGKCNDGVHDYVIVTNMVDSTTYEEDRLGLAGKVDVKEFKADPDMSCGVLLHELLRVYQRVYCDADILKISQLAQWAGVTLITDCVELRNRRNQWFIEQLTKGSAVETNLKSIIQGALPYYRRPDISLIEYSVAPLFNKAIRAGASSEALNILLNSPLESGNLTKYGEVQKEATRKALYTVDEDGNQVKINWLSTLSSYVILEIEPSIKNYSGVIAANIQGSANKNVAVYRYLTNGLVKGSFRGRSRGVDYRRFFENYRTGIYAQGHDSAFGFECYFEELKDIMKKLPTIENEQRDNFEVSLGDMPDKDKGQYHFDNWDSLRYYAGLMRIAMGNARVLSDAKINIKVHVDNVKPIKQTGKTWDYDVMGVACKAFDKLEGLYFYVYVEYTSEINFFIRSYGGR